MQRLRNRSRPLAGQVLALLAAVWLNLWLSPCVMAMSEAMAGGMPEHAQSAGEHCGHCPKPEAPCDPADSASCALVDQALRSGNAPVSLFDNSSFELALPTPEQQWLPGPQRHDTFFLHDARPPDRSVPLYLVHCAFLK